MRTLLLVLLAFSAFALPAQAQSSPASVTHTLIEENDGWRVHAGDDPAFAAPTFDDSSWQQAPAFGNDLTGPAAQGDWHWFRKRIVLPAHPGNHPGPIDLFLVSEKGSYEMYVDGRRIGPAIRSSLVWVRRSDATVTLRSTNAEAPREVLVAIRSHLKTTEFIQLLNMRSAATGDPQAVQTAAAAYRGRYLGRVVFPVAMMILGPAAGLLLVALYLQQRQHSEYLWLGLSIFFFAFSVCAGEAQAWAVVPMAFNAFWGDPCTYFCMAAQLEFIYAFVGRRPGRLVRAYKALLVLVPFVFNPLLWTGVFPPGTLEWVEDLLTLPGMILVVFLLVVWRRRGVRDAGLLLVPILFANLANFVGDIEFFIQVYRPNFELPFLTLGGVRFTYTPFAVIPFVLAAGFLVFRRFTQVSHDQASAEADLASARSIQQILIPEALPHIPGLRIESVYHPAQQVGGDFFQIIPREASGETLIVLGDVSGKGLPAAMQVALLVGAIRSLAETISNPAELLAGLNRRLLGRGSGFTTCLALRIGPDGRATIASAGHLNPYLNGREILLDNGLPLGLDAGAVYASALLALSPGDTLTLLTDGVPEARNPHTHELFGFERTAAISGLSAASIADTARAFGQEDDIAVLTLAFAGSQ